ncbi:hypothetical protein HY227_01815 [Candidatus Wolfebacteria bacterium]|nr:hypothetical protein [Candidatus Wolfebacteria bacterium]
MKISEMQILVIFSKEREKEKLVMCAVLAGLICKGANIHFVKDDREGREIISSPHRSFDILFIEEELFSSRQSIYKLTANSRTKPNVVLVKFSSDCKPIGVYKSDDGFDAEICIHRVNDGLSDNCLREEIEEKLIPKLFPEEGL